MHRRAASHSYWHNPCISVNFRPVAFEQVAVNVAAMGWRSYGGGIFSGGCTTDKCSLDHVVQAVGYKRPGELGGQSHAQQERQHHRVRAIGYEVEGNIESDPVEGFWIIRNS